MEYKVRPFIMVHSLYQNSLLSSAFDSIVQVYTMQNFNDLSPHRPEQV